MLDTDSEARPAAATSGDFPRDYWYAALASQRLADKPIGVQVLDWRLALFRDADGRPHGLHDRCAHRGAELHLGEVTEGAMARRVYALARAGRWEEGRDGLTQRRIIRVRS